MELASDPNSNGQLRNHLDWGPIPKLRIRWHSRRLGRCGEGAYFERNVRVMRYPKNVRIGDHAIIKEGARICPCNPQARIRIGSRTTVGYQTFIFASDSITIGDDCLIAPFVYLVDSNHGTRRDTPINRQGNVARSIHVGNDVWVGVGARLLAGVKVGDGAIIAAGAVIATDVAPYTIVGGVPARQIGERQ